MKSVTIIIFVSFSSFFYSQTEQISIDFFANKILPDLKRTKVFYDGKVIPKSTYEEQAKNHDEETIIEMILWDYSMCKKDSSKVNFKDVIKFANVKNSTTKNLNIPENIGFRRTLIIKKRKVGKLNYKFKNILKQKYNLKVSPSIQINENTYLTRIFMTKQDFEHGNNYDIIVQNHKVIDWCNNSWIQ